MKTQIRRLGAYGILVKEGQILLALHDAGPYKGMWGLPGGAIEFGESPEEALKREFLEEAALDVEEFELMCTITANDSYMHNDEPCDFHLIGIIYRILQTKETDLEPEDVTRWFKIETLKADEITPLVNLTKTRLEKSVLI